MSTNARNRTLSRMKTLIAIGSAATSLAATHCSDIGGFETVDPLPGPGGGGCGDFSSTFTITARTGRVDLDASTNEDADADADAADADAGNGADADAGIGDGEDDGGGMPSPDAGPPPVTGSTSPLLLSIAGLAGGFPSSLKSATTSLNNVSTPNAVTLGEALASDAQLDIYLTLVVAESAGTPAGYLSFDLEIERVSCSSFGGSSETTSITLHVTMDSTRKSVQSITASLGGANPQQVGFLR